MPKSNKTNRITAIFIERLMLFLSTKTIHKILKAYIEFINTCVDSKWVENSV